MPARPSAANEPARGKSRRFARGTDPAGLIKHAGLRRVVAQPGQFTDHRPLPGVPPLPTQSSVVASKVLATFPSDSEPARLARIVLANPEHAANAETIETRKPARKDLTPRSRMASAALHRFGAVCYIRSGPRSARAQPAQANHGAIANPAQSTPPALDPASVSLKRPLWKRIFG